MDLSRREYLALAGAAGVSSMADAAGAAQTNASLPGDSDREQRLRWWREAKFGMFIHWGLYSVLGRREWVLEQEAIPLSEYIQLAKLFNPQPNAARQWARLAKRAGQRYMVMTTKHHEGFCLFNTKFTDYCAPKQACGRDLVAEYVEAARAEGLRVGFYYSLMDWHHPDGQRCATGEAARKRFIEYIHGQIRELLTNYGKIDILWYDVAQPLDEKGWEAELMNRMAFELQPHIIVNNRNRLPGDFGTPEQRITAEDRAWESCMTMNGSWGYCKTDDEWKSPRVIVQNLVTCARGGGNYLLNIGPRADGSVPEPSVRTLEAVGDWLSRNGSAVYGTERCRVTYSELAHFTRKGNRLFIHVHFWDGDTLSIAGLETKVRSAKLLGTGQTLTYKQDQYRLLFTGLPVTPPDYPVTVIEAECESEPVQANRLVIRSRARGSV
jgi:alpha-L-fucosidase